jgi:hypothetical protein
MAAPQNFPRDAKGKTARMLLKDVTDTVFAFLEALAKAEVVITPAGRATGKVLASLTRWKLHIDLKTQQWTHTLAGTETVPDGGIFRVIEIFNTGLPDGTPVAVDTPGLIYPVMFVGASVAGGTITLNYWSAYGSATMPAGVITVRPIL